MRMLKLLIISLLYPLPFVKCIQLKNICFQVWDACSDALISFTSSDMMGDDIAYIVENDLLLHAVNTELTSPSVKNVQIVYGAKISGYKLTRETSDCNIVKLDNGDTYLCDLLVSEPLFYWGDQGN